MIKIVNAVKQSLSQVYNNHMSAICENQNLEYLCCFMSSTYTHSTCSGIRPRFETAPGIVDVDWAGSGVANGRGDRFS